MNDKWKILRENVETPADDGGDSDTLYRSSIAISLKRIADALEKIEAKTGWVAQERPTYQAYGGGHSPVYQPMPACNSGGPSPTCPIHGSPAGDSCV